MSKVAARIEQAPACQVINLTDFEKQIYTGAGWKIARFEDGVLVGFFDPADVPDVVDSAQEAAEAAMNNAIAWLANAQGETWLVMCSCCQLCEPRRVSMDDAASIAHMARVLGDQAADDW